MTKKIRPKGRNLEDQGLKDRKISSKKNSYYI